jgi:hypothetical protein
MITKAMRELGFRREEVEVVGDIDGNMGAAAAGKFLLVTGAAYDFLEAAYCAPCSPSGAAEQRCCGIAGLCDRRIRDGAQKSSALWPAGDACALLPTRKSPRRPTGKWPPARQNNSVGIRSRSQESPLAQTHQGV